MPIRFDGADASMIRYMGADVTNVFYPLSSTDTESDKNAFSSNNPPESHVISAVQTTSGAAVTSGSTIPANTDVTFTSTVVDSDGLTGGTYNWRRNNTTNADGTSLGTFTHPTNTVTSGTESNVTNTYQCFFTDAGGLEIASNVISITWEQAFDATFSVVATVEPFNCQNPGGTLTGNAPEWTVTRTSGTLAANNISNFTHSNPDQWVNGTPNFRVKSGDATSAVLECGHSPQWLNPSSGNYSICLQAANGVNIQLTGSTCFFSGCIT